MSACLRSRFLTTCLGLLSALLLGMYPSCDNAESNEGGDGDSSADTTQSEYSPVGGTFDFTFNGSGDCVLVDSSGDGFSDGLDFDEDGLPNVLLVDTDGDGVSDAIDADGNGTDDAYLIGPSPDGNFGLSTHPFSGDPVILLDTDDDGIFDGLDLDYDSIAEFDISNNL